MRIGDQCLFNYQLILLFLGAEIMTLWNTSRMPRLMGDTQQRMLKTPPNAQPRGGGTIWRTEHSMAGVCRPPPPPHTHTHTYIFSYIEGPITMYRAGVVRFSNVFELVHLIQFVHRLCCLISCRLQSALDLFHTLHRFSDLSKAGLCKPVESNASYRVGRV
jgi:hypothetical protein